LTTLHKYNWLKKHVSLNPPTTSSIGQDPTNGIVTAVFSPAVAEESVESHGKGNRKVGAAAFDCLPDPPLSPPAPAAAATKKQTQERKVNEGAEKGKSA
jgi:hypothetical protein